MHDKRLKMKSVCCVLGVMLIGCFNMAVATPSDSEEAAARAKLKTMSKEERTAFVAENRKNFNAQTEQRLKKQQQGISAEEKASRKALKALNKADRKAFVAENRKKSEKRLNEDAKNSQAKLSKEEKQARKAFLEKRGKGKK